jgi:hypothetical protein
MKRVLGLVLFTVIVAVGVCAQEVTKAPNDEPAKTTTQTTTQTTTPDYVFPDANERFNRYVKSTIGPMRLLRTGAAAGVGQWKDDPEEWGQGMKGYGKRYASGLGQNAIQQTVTYGLDEAFGVHTGFEKSKREGFFPRVKDALLENVTSRTKSGKRVISVPRLTGVYTGAIIPTETWYPERYSYKDGLRYGTTTLLTGFGINLVREFIFNF